MFRRVSFLLLILLLLVAPVSNAWCATECLAQAISHGCAHGLHPTDDLPVEKTAKAIAAGAWIPAPAPEHWSERHFSTIVPSVRQQIPLRI